MQGIHVIFRSTVILFLSLLALPGTLRAAEVVNLKTHYSSTRLVVEYDLAGTGTETESAVDVQLEVKGKKYSPNMLSISGDFGRSIALGSHRQITWHHSLDFPEGMETVFKCNVNAIPASRLLDESVAPAEGFRAIYFALNRQTLVETRTQLMWSRNANHPVKPMRYRDAQSHVEKLNRERFAGYNDWRIPTREDFEGLVYWGKKAGWGYELAHFIADYLSACGFENVQPGNYWTSAPDEASLERSLVVNTWNGNFRSLEKSNYYHLWPVRTAR
jgi:hypothetical protein